MAADFALKLGFSFAVIVVDVGVRSIAERTNNVMRDFLRSGAVVNRAERLAVFCVIL